MKTIRCDVCGAYHLIDYSKLTPQDIDHLQTGLCSTCRDRYYIKQNIFMV